MTDGRRAILTPVDQPDCSTDPDLTSTVGWFCSVLLTADWSWRGNGLMDREETGNQNQNQSLC